MRAPSWTLAAGSLVGPRESNQDRYLRESYGSQAVFAIADGMGGLSAGDRAANFAIEVLRERIVPCLDAFESPDAIAEAFFVGTAEATERVHRLGERSGTTLTAVAGTSDSIVLAHVGDSRAYRFRDGRLRPLTRDDNLFEASGMGVPERHPAPMTSEERSSTSVLTAFVGGERAEPCVATLDVALEDWYVLTSDGLHGELDDDAIESALKVSRTPRDAASRLLRMAQGSGLNDNATVVVAAFATNLGAKVQDPSLLPHRLREWIRADTRRPLLPALAVASTAVAITFLTGKASPNQEAKKFAYSLMARSRTSGEKPSTDLLSQATSPNETTLSTREALASLNSATRAWQVQKAADAKRAAEERADRQRAALEEMARQRADREQAAERAAQALAGKRARAVVHRAERQRIARANRVGAGIGLRPRAVSARRIGSQAVASTTPAVGRGRSPIPEALTLGGIVPASPSSASTLAPSRSRPEAKKGAASRASRGKKAKGKGHPARAAIFRAKNSKSRGRATR